MGSRLVIAISASAKSKMAESFATYLHNRLLKEIADFGTATSQVITVEQGNSLIVVTNLSPYAKARLLAYHGSHRNLCEVPNTPTPDRYTMFAFVHVLDPMPPQTILWGKEIQLHRWNCPSETLPEPLPPAKKRMLKNTVDITDEMGGVSSRYA